MCIMSTKKIGDLGEKYALQFLKKKKYKILETNFHAYGGEIDIVAQKDDYLVFVEVKARHTKRYGAPEQAVDSRKLSRIKKAAHYFLQKHKDKKLPQKYAVEIVAIELSGQNIKEIRLIKEF